MKQLLGITTALMLLSLFVTPTVFADDGDKAALDSAALDRLLNAAIDDANANGVLMDKADSLRFKIPHPTAKDTADFVAIYRQLADGLPWAAYQMGEVYLFGWSVSVDTVQAVNWYVKSAEMGDTRGMRSAGIVYLEGIGGRTADIPAGLNWLAKSAEGGNLEAASYLGELYFLGNKYTTQNDQLALKYLYLASDSNDVESQKHIADIFYDLQSPYANDSMAFVWANYLASKGEAKYEYRLGSCYYDGIGVDVDAAKAGIYFYQAAMQNDGAAEYVLATMCLYGEGTKVDYVQSYAWAQRALEPKSEKYDAQDLIDSLDIVMTPAQKDSAKTIVPDWDPFTEADARYEEVKKKRDEQIKAGKVRPGSKGQTRGGRGGASAPTTTTDSATATDSTNTKTTTPQTKSRRPR